MRQAMDQSAQTFTQDQHHLQELTLYFETVEEENTLSTSKQIDGVFNSEF